MKENFKDIVQATMAATTTYNKRFHTTLTCTSATLFLANNVTDTALNKIYMRHASRQRKEVEPRFSDIRMSGRILGF